MLRPWLVPVEVIDLNSNPGVGPIAPPTGETQLLPYSPKGDVSVVTKRVPFKFGKFKSTVKKVAKNASNVVKVII